MICRRIQHAVHQVAAAALIFLCVVAVIGSALAGAFVGQAVKTLGDVHVTRDGADLSVGPGTALQLGDIIKTGPGARFRLRFVDGSILTLGENTSLSIDIFAVDGTNKSRTVILTLLSGVVNAAAAKSGEDEFDYQIKTANAYSAVRGTKWIVGARQGVTGVYVLNGLVELGTGAGQPALIPAGSWSSVDAQGKLSPIAPTTPEMLQVLLDATSDNGGGAPSTTPTPAPIQTPSLPLPDQNPDYNRAFRKNNDSGGSNDRSSKGSGGYSN